MLVEKIDSGLYFLTFHTISYAYLQRRKVPPCHVNDIVQDQIYNNKITDFINFSCKLYTLKIVRSCKNKYEVFI